MGYQNPNPEIETHDPAPSSPPSSSYKIITETTVAEIEACFVVWLK